MQFESRNKWLEKHLPLFFSFGLSLAFLITGVVFGFQSMKENDVLLKQIVVIFTIFLSFSLSLWGFYIKSTRDSYDRIKISQSISDTFSRLNQLAEQLVMNKSSHAEKVAKDLGDDGYEVVKKDMFGELIQLCTILDEAYEEDIVAISGIDIDDFACIESAKDYLSASTQCILRGVPVRRLFVLDDESYFERDNIESALDSTYSALNEEPVSAMARGVSARAQSHSGLLWLMKSQLDEAEKKWAEMARKNVDFALFGGEKRGRIIVTQQVSGTASGLQRLCKMTTNKKHCMNSYLLFNELWELAIKKNQNYAEFKKKVLEKSI